jgi:hypothetical protein
MILVDRMDESSSPSSGIDALRDLERWLSGQAARAAGISQVERESELRGREILRVALQAHIDARGDGDVGAAIVLAIEHGPVRLALKRPHTRPLVTLLGEVKVTRVGYGTRGRDAIHPLDAELMLPGHLWSYECQRRLLRAVVCGPFDEAIALVAEITGTTVPKRSAEQLVQEAAVDFETFYAARAAELIAPADGEILVGAIDCKGIPMVKVDGARHVVRRGKGEKANKKKMATVAAVHNQPPIVRTPARSYRQPVRHPSALRAAQATPPQPQARVGQPDRRQRHLHRRRQRRDDPSRAQPPTNLGDRHRRRALAPAPRDQDL